ncbi:MAG: Ig domain-containing protein [Prevotella sp.]|nr:Ig domain-containing protein [Prevotella sp.]
MKQIIIKLSFLAFSLLASMNVVAQQTSLTVDNQVPGWLSIKIANDDQLTVENLKVTGYLNNEDLQFIARLMKENSLHGRLDLEEANIVSSTGSTNNYLIYDEKVWGENLDILSASLKLNYLSLPQTIVNGDKKAMGKLNIDTLFINTKTGFAKTLYATVKHIVIGENISILKYPALSDLHSTIETIELPSTLKEIRETWNSTKSFNTINCKIVNGKNLRELPSLERLVATFSVTEMPDSVFLPNIRVLSLNQYHDYHSNSMFKSGMHVFIGEKIDTLTEMSDAKNIHLHFASPQPPVVESSITYHGQPENQSYFYLHVPMGSAAAYRACFKYGGTKVNIIEEIIDVTDVALDKHEVNLNVGDTHTFSVAVSPEKATYKSVKWLSDNIEVAEINTLGVVTAKKAGKALITVSSVSNPEIKDYCEITVVQPATSVEMDETEITLVQNKGTKQLVATIKPDNTSDKTIFWSSSDSNVATVDANGMVTAQKTGKATITATAASNEEVKATCVVTVIQPVTGISLSESSLTMTQLGEMKQLVPNVMPEDATNKAVKWSSSNTAVCVVSENGTVIATGYGMATIVATTVDGGFPVACVVNVISVATDIKQPPIDAVEVAKIYNVTGNRLGMLQRGVNIMKKADGTTQKVFVK